MRAAVDCADRGIARCLLLGAPDEVAAQARHLGLRLPEGVTVLDPRTVAERYVAPLAELRRHKGWTEEVAREHLADPITVGTMMLSQGEVGRPGVRRGAHHGGHRPPRAADLGHQAGHAAWCPRCSSCACPTRW